MTGDIMKCYLCIDLKSFYASVECIERNLDPLTTNLVVADESRTDKTICLAVSPSLKQYKIPGRARLYEIKQKVKKINYERKKEAYQNKFIGKSHNDIELKQNKNLELDYIIAPPRMAHYIDYSAKIYNVYLKYLSEEDIYVYSIDEVFCDITKYLKYYKLTPKQLTTKILKDVLKETGITATAGLGTNPYLAKVAMDIEAKKKKPDEFGVRIAALDEKRYRLNLWNHRPLTDFWRVGKGYAKKLEENNIYTMGDIAKTSIENEDLLYKLFGVNAETLIDHAWGYEPCTIKDIKNYKPTSNSITTGQVLHCAYGYTKTKLIVKEMIDLLSLDLVKRKYLTNQIVLTIGYDIENITNGEYKGETKIDMYGRKIPKQAHGTINIDHYTQSSKILIEKVVELYEKIIDNKLLIKRINISATNLIRENENVKITKQFDLFTNINAQEEEIKKEKTEQKLQQTMLNIKQKYGKNSILKAMNLEEGATTIERNKQIGGHQE